MMPPRNGGACHLKNQRRKPCCKTAIIQGLQLPVAIFRPTNDCISHAFFSHTGYYIRRLLYDYHCSKITHALTSRKLYVAIRWTSPWSRYHKTENDPPNGDKAYLIIKLLGHALIRRGDTDGPSADGRGGVPRRSATSTTRRPVGLVRSPSRLLLR